MSQGLVTPLFSQSSAESVKALQGEFNEIVAKTAQDLRVASENPDSLGEGALQTKLETTGSALGLISSKIDGAADILSKKEANINNKALKPAEKKELTTALANQKKPLSDLRLQIAQLQKKLASISATELPAWRDTYAAFESIKNKDVAQRKVAEMIQSSLAPVPVLATAYAQSVSSREQQSSLPRKPAPSESSFAAKGSLPPTGLETNPTMPQRPKTSEVWVGVETPNSPEKKPESPDEKLPVPALLFQAGLAIGWLVLLIRAGKQSAGAGSWGNIFCALNSFVFPGLGQLAQRRFLLGCLFFFGTGLLWTIYMGWTMHIWAAVDAARWKRAPKPA